MAKTHNSETADDSWSYGKVMATATQRRVQIPEAVWSQLNLTSDNEANEVMVELVSPGHIRVRRLSEAEPWVAALRAKFAAEAKGNSDARRNLGALGDRYRKMTIYEGGRLPLLEEIGSFLGIEPYTPGRKLYIQGAAGAIDVMTMGKRLQYQDESQNDITI